MGGHNEELVGKAIIAAIVVLATKFVMRGSNGSLG